MDEELAFLDPGFDFTKLTKPQLRGILGAHSPQDLPPASCKKEELIEAIKQHVLPLRRSILSARKKVRPSSAGIAFLDEHSRPTPHKESPSARPKPSGRTASPTKMASSSPMKTPTRSSGRSRSSTRSPVRSRSRARQKPAAAVPADITRSSGSNISPLSVLERCIPGYLDSPKTATRKLSDRLESIAKYSPDFAKHYVDWSIVSRVVLSAMRAALMVSVTVAFTFFFRWKFLHPFPYCDTSHAPVSLVEYIQSPWSREYCLPCPRHGKCASGKLSCLDGFTAKADWGFGLQCVPDRKQLEQIDRIGRRVASVLSRRAGQAICSGTVPGKTSESVLHDLVFENIPKFDQFFKLAIDDIPPDEVKVSHSADGKRLFESLRPSLTLSCKVKLHVWTFCTAHRQGIMATLATIAFIMFAHIKIINYRYRTVRVSELASNVLSLLAEQSAVHLRDPLVPATLIVDQLRDAILLKSPQDRYLWPSVCKAVSANANVREQSLHARGEYLLAWEWIGMDMSRLPSTPTPIANRASAHHASAPTRSEERSLYPSSVQF